MANVLDMFKNKQPISPPLPMQQETMQQYAANEALNDYLNSINSGQVDYVQNLVNQMGADKVINGIQQGLNFGIPEISQWQQQYNAGAGRNNPIVFPQTQEEIATAQQGNFAPITGGVAAKPETGFLQGLRDLQSGFRENANTPFKMDNLQADPNKTNMFRVGEGFGTAGRFAASPAGRGLIVGGLVGATGGSPLEMMGYGGATTVKNQQLRMADQLYRAQLKQLGYSDEQLDQVLGYIGSGEMKNISESEYKRIINEVRKQNANVNESYKKSDIKVKQQNADTNQNKAKTDAWYKGEQVKIGRQNANSNTKRADAYAERVADVGTENAAMGEDLAEYLEIIGGNDPAASEYARKSFIRKYKGKDPDKLLKSNDTERLIEAIMSK